MNRLRKAKDQKGFTMLELMVVVVIVGILAAIAVPIYGKYVRNARVTEATARIGEVVTAAKAWAQEHPNANGNPEWPTEADAKKNDNIIDITSLTQNVSGISLQGGGDATTSELVVTVTGRNKLAGVTVIATVPDINSNAELEIKGL